MKILKDGKEITLGETVPSDTPIPVDVYRRGIGEDGKPTGYIHRVAGRPVAEVARDLCKALEQTRGQYDLECGDKSESSLIDEYAGIGLEYKYDNIRGEDLPLDWPEMVHNIACYAVRGGSEGHYVHVEIVVCSDEPRKRAQHIGIATIKTFRGLAHARKIAAEAYYLLTGERE